MFTIVMTSLMMLGCASEKLTKQQFDELRETSTVYVVHYPPSPFQVRTELNMAGLIPLFIAVAMGPGSPKTFGKKLRDEYALEDPARLVKEAVGAHLREKVDFRNLLVLNEEQIEKHPPDAPRMIASEKILAFTTIEWDLMYYQHDTSFHYLIYRGEARLIDPNSDNNWEGECEYSGGAPKNARRTIENFTADNAALLKAELRRAAKVCTNQLIKQLIS